MALREFFSEKGIPDTSIIHERVGMWNVVYTVQAGEDTYFCKMPEQTVVLARPIPLDNGANEHAAMNAARTVIPDLLPSVFHFNKDDKILITKGPGKKASSLRFDLLDGTLDLDVVKKLAYALKKVHGVTTADVDPVYFDRFSKEIKYDSLAEAYPVVGKALIDNINEKKCLTHGDFNPKNIITFDNGFYIIDWEQAVISSPEHDIGNMLGHYLLKAVHLGKQEYTQAYKVFMEAYGGGVDENLIKGHMGATLWARVNTRAKAQYLSPETKRKVEEVAKQYLDECKQNLPIVHTSS